MLNDTALEDPVRTAALTASAGLALTTTPAAAQTAPAEPTVVLSVHDGDDPEIAVRAPDGPLRVLTDNRAGDSGPVWSPDGTRIVSVSAAPATPTSGSCAPTARSSGG